MVKIRLGLAAAGGVLVAMEWLMISHTIDWVLSGFVPV